MKSRSKLTFEPGGLFSKLSLPSAFKKRVSETRFRQEWKVPVLGGSILTLTDRCVKSEFVGPKRQVGALLVGRSRTYHNAIGIVVMSGYTSTFSDAGNTVYSGISFLRNGTIEETGPGIGTTAQVDAGEWWSKEPVTDIGDNYDVRLETGGTGAWDTLAASAGTYIALTTTRLWRCGVLSKDAPDVSGADGTFAIRPTGGGADLDSAVYAAFAEN